MQALVFRGACDSTPRVPSVPDAPVCGSARQQVPPAFDAGAATIGRTLGEALATFVTKQYSLETLELKTCNIDGADAGQLDRALSNNCAVKLLRMQELLVNDGVVKELCHAARSNEKLKKLLLLKVVGFSQHPGRVYRI